MPEHDQHITRGDGPVAVQVGRTCRGAVGLHREGVAVRVGAGRVGVNLGIQAVRDARRGVDAFDHPFVLARVGDEAQGGVDVVSCDVDESEVDEVRSVAASPGNEHGFAEAPFRRDVDELQARVGAGAIVVGGAGVVVGGAGVGATQDVRVVVAGPVVLFCGGGRS